MFFASIFQLGQSNKITSEQLGKLEKKVFKDIIFLGKTFCKLDDIVSNITWTSNWFQISNFLKMLELGSFVIEISKEMKMIKEAEARETGMEFEKQIRKEELTTLLKLMDQVKKFFVFCWVLDWATFSSSSSSYDKELRLPKAVYGTPIAKVLPICAIMKASK